MAMLRHKSGVIVDPNAASRSALRAMLSAIGMVQVVQAAGSVDALRRVKEKPADIILCDYLLEDGRDGQQLLEEMRNKHLIPLSTAFIVITRERRYQSVVSVAELAPDDYLLKPFTPQHLLERLEAVLEKKHAFRHAHRHLEAGEAEATLNACDAVCRKYSHYRLDALRLKAETLMALKRTAEAEALYRQILAVRAVPWAKMGLAFASHEAGQLDEAADLTLDVISNHPNYIAAYDLAARIDEDRGRLAEAQQHLQSAVSHAPHGLMRQRHLGQLAAQNGDLETAETALRTVISRAAGSSLREVADYAQLVRLQVAAGKGAAALETVAALRKEMRDDPAAPMVGCALAALTHSRMGNAAEADAAAELAIEASSRAGHEVQASVLVDVSQALIVSGRVAAGESVLRRAIALGEGDERFGKYMNRVMASFEATAGVADNLREDVRQRLVHINNEGVRLGQAGHLDEAIKLFREAMAQMPSVQMFANAAKAILAKLNRDGWDEPMAEEARGYLQQAKRQAVADARVDAAIAAYAQVAVKYGIKTDALRES
jgi:tetratricopeptide (TPR) repeat protein